MKSCFLSYLVIATFLNEKLSIMGSSIYNWDQFGAGGFFKRYNIWVWIWKAWSTGCFHG